MCEYALQIEGLLDHSAYYYMNNEEIMEHQISQKGSDIMDALSISTNSTITTPLMTQVE